MKDIIIRHESNILSDKYTDYVCESFDINDSEKTVVEIKANLSDIDSFEWNIGVIYGGSGTGKTTILKNHFKKDMSYYQFDKEKSLISNFDFLEPKEASLLLSAMGLASVPTWLRPYHTLSNGEQYRAQLAYMVGIAKQDEVILIDEYTSVVDRNVAKAMSNALQKYIRRTGKKIVLASCHFDIMEWILPDWTYSPLKGRIERAECLRLARPKIELQIFRCRYKAWDIFKQHHYLSQELNKAAKCFVATWNDVPIAFCAILPLPSGYLKNSFRISRVVVLPDYQGLGVGFNFLNYISSLYKKQELRMFIKTSSPALGEAMLRSYNWKETSKSRQSFSTKEKKSMGSNIWGFNNKDFFYAFEYCGESSLDDDSIIKFKSEAYNSVSQNQISLF